MSCVRIGYGTIATLHESKLHAMGVRTAAVVEVDPGKRRLAEMSGHTVLRSCAEASSLAPTFWDVCAPTSQHLPLIEAILTIDRGAKILAHRRGPPHVIVSILVALILSSLGSIHTTPGVGPVKVRARAPSSASGPGGLALAGALRWHVRDKLCHVSLDLKRLLSEIDLRNRDNVTRTES